MEQMERKSPLSDLMRTAMEKVHEMVDTNSIVGEPIVTADGVTLIPISKLWQRRRRLRQDRAELRRRQRRRRQDRPRGLSGDQGRRYPGDARGGASRQHRGPGH